MSWINKTLSIFGWKKQEAFQPSKKEADKSKGVKTFGDLKKWIDEELPPLALQRVNLRISKFAFQNFGIVLSKINDEQIIPEALYEKINEVVKELFNKEVPNGN